MVVVVVVVVVAVGGVWCGTDGAAMLMRKAFRGAYPSRWLNCVAFVGFLNALAIIGWQVGYLPGFTAFYWNLLGFT